VDEIHLHCTVDEKKIRIMNITPAMLLVILDRERTMEESLCYSCILSPILYTHDLEIYMEIIKASPQSCELMPRFYSVVHINEMIPSCYFPYIDSISILFFKIIKPETDLPDGFK
jgi:hypothetical protein